MTEMSRQKKCVLRSEHNSKKTSSCKVARRLFDNPKVGIKANQAKSCRLWVSPSKTFVFKSFLHFPRHEKSYVLFSPRSLKTRQINIDCCIVKHALQRLQPCKFMYLCLLLTVLEAAKCRNSENINFLGIWCATRDQHPQILQGSPQKQCNLSRMCVVADTFQSQVRSARQADYLEARKSITMLLRPLSVKCGSSASKRASRYLLSHSG